MNQVATEKISNGVAVITGGGGGLGSGLAKEAASLGMTVVIADIALGAAEDVATHIRSCGGNASAHKVDVSVAEEVETLAKFVFETHGSVRLLVNNAAIETLGLCWEVSQRSWDSTINVNLQGVVHGIRAFVPKMIESGEDCWIANVSSLGVFSNVPSQSAYITTKAAVQALTEGLYVDLKLVNSKIRVSSVVPGLLRTNIFHGKTGMSNDSSRLQKYRNFLARLAEQQGLEIETASKIILKGIFEGNFWITTHPDLAGEFLERRVQFIRGQQPPQIAPGTITMFDF